MEKLAGSGLERIANITSITVAALFALTIPAGYFLTLYQHMVEDMESQARISAIAISEVVYRDPEYWSFQEYRLDDVLSQAIWHRRTLRYKIVDNDGEQVLVSGVAVESPSLTATAILSDGAQQVGTISVTGSLRPLWIETLVVSVFGVFLALIIHILMKVLPFAALRRVMNTLRDSQKRLINEVEAKEDALKQWIAVSEKMHKVARRDALTNSPNRLAFNETVLEMIEEADDGKKFALMFLDLNRFKEINDTLGHEAGDGLLVLVAQRLRECLEDTIFLARLGGDEFAVVIPDAGSEEAKQIAEEIEKSLQPHFALEGYHIAVNASIGIACYPDHGKQLKTLMRNADIAMYHGKTSGTLINQYDGSYDSSSPSRLTLAAGLRQAIDNDDLELHYQPKVHLASGDVIGAEALTRWKHPEYGFISPELFISISEQSGLINELTEWVLDSAIRQISLWHKQNQYLSVSVNISAKNLQHDGLTGTVKRLLSEHTVPANHLVLEITEGSIMTDPDKAAVVIRELADIGMLISIDDFGTGYSSLAYLKRLTVDELKIDKSFVFNMLEDPEDQVIVRSTVDLAHNLGMSVVAEGIESTEVADLLKSYGCDVAQGYYYSRPVPASDFIASQLAAQASH